VNDADKLKDEYHSKLADNQTYWLKIRFTPGMEMLAKELATGRRIYEQDFVDPNTSPRTVIISPDGSELSPSISPSPPPPSPASSPSPIPASPHPVITRRRSQRWMIDATGSFPTLFIEESKVSFYSTLAELKQGISDRSDTGRNKVVINIANVISVEKIITRRSYSQSIVYPDVEAGINGQEPKIVEEPLTIDSPQEIPAITDINQEMMFKILAHGGQAPYRYSMINAPTDLYVTEDGWVRGFIEEDQWPTSDFREFVVLILVEDSSIPVQTAGLEFRYRLYPRS
jgi:hypothetical protein